MKIIKILIPSVLISSCHLRESNKLIRSDEEYQIARLSNQYFFTCYDTPRIVIILEKITDSKINFTSAKSDELDGIKVEFFEEFEDKNLKKKLNDKKTTSEEREKILKEIKKNKKKKKIILELSESSKLKNVNNFSINMMNQNGKKYSIQFEIHRNVQLLNYKYGLSLTYEVKNIRVDIPKCNISKNIVNQKLNRLDNEIEIQY